ncbi:MAG TPA: threonine/serine exporter family protein [Micromonospora sp.]|nr:threonine/serine exporter family protein [Micromonospora sp.]
MTEPARARPIDHDAASPTRSALALALRVGEALLASGATRADVAAAILRIAAAYGVPSCHADVTFNSITVVSGHPVDGPLPLTLMRVVSLRGSDYTRLDRVVAFVARLGREPLPVHQAHAALDDILGSAPPYRNWVATLAAAGLAAAVAVLIGGGALTAVTAAAASALVDRTLRLLTRAGLPSFFQHAVGAGLVSIAPIALLLASRYAGLDVSAAPPSLVVGAGLVVLLAGLSLVNVAQDAISGYLVTASARVLEVLLPTLGIVVGIAAVLDLSRAAGMPLHLAAAPGLPVPLWLQLLAAAIASSCWALCGYATRRAVLVSAAGGGAVQLAYVVAKQAGVETSTASFLAALAVGFAVTVVARRVGTSPMVAQACAIVPLLPGIALYRGMFEVVEGVPAGSTALMQACGVALALGAGVALGEFLAVSLQGSRDRWDRLVRHRARGSRY